MLKTAFTPGASCGNFLGRYRAPSHLRLTLDLGTDMAENGHQNSQGAEQKLLEGFQGFFIGVAWSECKVSNDKWQVWKFWTAQL